MLQRFIGLSLEIFTSRVLRNEINSMELMLELAMGIAELGLLVIHLIRDYSRFIRCILVEQKVALLF